jgi:pimeloyl-ACP methyl ester carboxylesterase
MAFTTAGLRRQPRRHHLPDDLRPPPPRRRIVVTSADGTRLAVEVHGEATGGPRATVVLSHGWTCSAAFWARVVHRLRGDLRVVVYDQRGHGRSQAVRAGGFTAEALADDLAAVVTATVPRGSPTVIAGHSMGAMAVVALAGRHPDVVRDRVGGVLLASTGVAELVGHLALFPVRGGRARPGDGPARRLLLELGLTDHQALQALPRPVARAVIAHVTLAPGATRAERAFTADVVLGCPPPTVAGFARMLAELDLVADLGRLSAPAVVLVGTRDRLTPPWHARHLAAALPCSLGLVELDGEGHMTPLTAPGSVTTAIRRLVRRIPAPGPADPADFAADGSRPGT